MGTDDINRFYADDYDEASRLSSGASLLELLRTQWVIERLLPDGPLRIADIGGGPGVYAEWLAGLGHDVVLVDPVQRHVDEAGALQPCHGSITAEVGDARALDLPDESFDAVLLLGPLYHLQARTDRDAALREALRVLRPGGLIFVAAISRFASFHDGLAQGFLFDADFGATVASTIATGIHANPTRNPNWFTDAYFHLPGELHVELSEAGLVDTTVIGLEGAAALLPDLDDRLGDTQQRQVLLDFLDQLDGEPSLLGVSPHLLGVGSKTSAR